MRQARLIATLSLSLALSTAGADAQSRPTAGAAWDACKSWVTMRLHRPEGLRFPEMGTAAVAIEATGERYRPNYLVRSHASLPGRDGSAERLPFSCLVQYRVQAYDLGRGYSLKRLTLPDSSVVLPPTSKSRPG